MTTLQIGDKVTMTVDAQYPRDHKAFCKIAKIINAGAVGVVVRKFSKTEAKRKLSYNEAAVLVKFPGTAWATGVWSSVADVKLATGGAR